MDKILLIEPDRAAREAATTILERLGFEAVAVDAETGISIHKELQPVAVLVGYPPEPPITGDSICKVFKPAAPVLALFPIDKRDLARRAMAEGCFDTIPKPLSFDVVKSILGTAIEHASS
jgi:DNA-binding NtrC family response regulator